MARFLHEAKFPITGGHVNVPAGAEPKSVTLADNNVSVWMVYDDTVGKNVDTWEFKALMSPVFIPDGFDYIGVVVMVVEGDIPSSMLTRHVIGRKADE